MSEQLGKDLEKKKEDISGYVPDNIPAGIPTDMCKPLWGCEKNAEKCPFYKEYLAGTPVAPSEGVTNDKAQQAQLKQLRQAAICVEKFQNANNKKLTDASPYQRAAFLMSTLWDTNQTLKISFLPLPPNYPGNQPQWDGSTRVPQTKRSGIQSGTGGSSCSNDTECQSSQPGFVCASGKCVEDIMPVWYTRDMVMTNMNPDTKLSPEDEEMERKVRSMDPVDAIRYVIDQQIQPLIGIKMEWVESDGDIRIKLDNRGGAWSYVGNQSKQIPVDKETMNFGWLDVSTIIHEFCHALGMVHEHQNPYGKGIDWNLRKVYSWATATQGWDMYTTCQNITKKYATDQVNGSDYDSKSIMLYSYPAWLTNDKIGTYRNIILSDSDKEWLSAIYPKAGERRIPQRVSQADAGQSSAGGLPWWGWLLIVLAVIALGLIVWWFAQKRRNEFRTPALDIPDY
jgi:hypothetical protein